jgi:DHA1 family multidrug resistance protein-like MFS transporter
MEFNDITINFLKMSGVMIVAWMVGSTVWLALPLYFQDFSMSPSEIGLIMSISGWVNMLTAIPIGRLIDKYGKKNIISIGLIGYSIEFFLLYLFKIKIIFYIVRLLDGFFLSMFFTGIYAFVSKSFTKSTRGGGMGVYQGFGGIGRFLGPPLLIGLILGAFSYKGYFLACGLMFLITGILIFMTVKEPELIDQKKTSVYDKEEGEKKTDFAKIVLITFTYSLGGSMLMPMFTLYLSQLGFSLAAISTVFSLNGFFSIIIPPLFGRLSDRLGRKRILFFGTLISSLSFLLFMFSETIFEIMFVRILQTVSTMIISPTVAAYIGDTLSKKRIGLGMGLYQTTLSFDRTMGTMIGGVVVDLASFNGVFLLGAISSMLSLIMSQFFIKTWKKERRTENT